MTPRGPADLVAAVPRALARRPADEVLLIGVADGAPSAALVYRLALDLDDDQTCALAAEAVARALADGAVQVAVLAYAPDALDDESRPTAVAATLHFLAEETGLRVLDAVAVTDSRWRSYTCSTPSCCPPEGHPIPEETPTP